MCYILSITYTSLSQLPEPDMSGNEYSLRCNLKEYRKRKGLSQDELARLVSVRRQAIYDMESGRYMPNTAVALRLARVLDCTVETLFAEIVAPQKKELQLPDGVPLASRLALARVRGELVGIPVQGAESMAFCLRPTDGLRQKDGQNVELLLDNSLLERTVLILGCDPALALLHEYMARVAPGMRAHTVFASSRAALQGIGRGAAHIAGIHFHNSGVKEANLEAVKTLLPGMECAITAFSLQEEGLMVASGNPLGLRDVADLAEGKARIVNREQGAALRTLLDTKLSERGIAGSAVVGYYTEVSSHCHGASCVACKVADAALGLRVVAESFGLDFVPLAVTRCDLVIPKDLYNHPGVLVLQDLLNSARFHKELKSIAGYDDSLTGKIISKPT